MVVAKTSASVLFTRARILLFALMVLAVVIPCASAGDLKGRVVNGTTGKAAAGDDVVLLSLSSDKMNETARTRTDSAGRFSLAVPDPQAVHVIRAIHQGVTYHQVTEPGAITVTLKVYEVADKLDAVSVVMDVERFEATSDRLEVKQLITMRNNSQPPRTLANGRPFIFHLPPLADVQYGLVQIGEGQPLRQKPFSGERPGEYYFLSPVRPGDTRFAVVYRLPYTGQANIQPAIRNSEERFVVMLPKSMGFEPTDPKIYQAMPGTTPDNVQGTAPVRPGSAVSFRISGTGMLAELQERPEQAKEIASVPADSRERPGGGLGVPIDAPDPLKEHRWAILGGLALALVAGATVVVVRRRPIGEAKTRKEILHDAPARSQPARAQSRVAPGNRRRRRSSTSQARAHG